MLLSNLIGKEIYTGKSVKGVCVGVGISLKTYAVKYLFCASSSQGNKTEFAISFSSISEIGGCITLSQLRPARPKSSAPLFLRKPVYAYNGNYLGALSDVAIEDGVATTLWTSEKKEYPVSLLAACGDAVILKKSQPYPLGQRLPKSAYSFTDEEQGGLVTKPLLRGAIQKGTLIRLTLSLSPFALWQ